MAAQDSDEELGLLADEDEGPGGHAAAKKKHEHHKSSSTGSDSLVARVVAAWRQPLGAASGLPGWLTRRLLPTREEQDSLSQLRQMADVAYNSEDPIHERTLRQLFAAVRGPEEARGLPSGGDPRWRDFGFQGDDPRTDFRGGGLLALQNMCHLAENYPDQMSDMLRQGATKRTEYLFAAALVNVSCMLVLLLGLNSRLGMSPAKKMPVPANAIARNNFAKTLSSPSSGHHTSAPEVFGELFSCAAMKMHAEWLAVCSRKPAATMLDFGEALDATAIALESMLDSLRAGEKPVQSVFGVLDFVASEHWLTKSRLYFYRWMSASLEFLCRVITTMGTLLGGFRKQSAREL